MPEIDLRVAKRDPPCIRGTGNIADGWRRRERGYGYYGVGVLPDFSGDRRLRVEVNIAARPSYRADRFREFPAELNYDGELTLAGTTVGAFRVKGGELRLVLEIQSMDDHITQIQRPLIFPRTELLSLNGARIELTTTVRLTPAPQGRPRDTYERDLLPFFRGGRIESNRRRH